MSSGQVRYALQRLWNPRTEKGLLSTLRSASNVRLVSDVLKETDDFFVRVEDSCQELARSATSSELDRTTPTEQPSRVWKELRIRRPDLVQDSLTLPLQRCASKSTNSSRPPKTRRPARS